MRMRLFVLAAVLLGWPWSLAGEARAQQGTASGWFAADGGERIALRHARALRTDEAADGRPEEQRIRLLLTDRPVSADIFENERPTSVEAMARDGELQGLLIEFDPADRTALRLVELVRPTDEFGLASTALADSEGLWTRLDSLADRVSGAFRYAPDEDGFGPGLEADLAFDAPVAHDPLQAVLTGEEARRSELVAVVLARIDQAMAALPAEQRQALTGIAEAAREPLRIVIRERSALFVIGGDDATMNFRLLRDASGWQMAQ